MITLSLLKFLEDNGMGKIDHDLFFQKLTLDRDGVYISDIGDAQARGARRSQTYELYSRGKSDVRAYKKLQSILDLITNSYSVCELPPVPPITDKGYKNVTLMPPSTITNAGLDINGRVLYSAVGQIQY